VHLLLKGRHSVASRVYLYEANWHCVKKAHSFYVGFWLGLRLLV
jgi:hypothetical protein